MKRLPIEVQAGVSHGIARPYGTILRARNDGPVIEQSHM